MDANQLGLSARGRTVVGRVISNKMDKTITVLVERRVEHPVYQKYMRRMTRFYAHDETNECNEGDLVKIAESRPISKNKCWRLVEVLERRIDN
jgi:small subunit ribosomal protein S17